MGCNLPRFIKALVFTSCVCVCDKGSVSAGNTRVMSLGFPVASLECDGARVTRREYRVASALPGARVLLTKQLDSLPCVGFSFLS